MTSKEQFREQFHEHEPEMLQFLEDIVEEFGRKSLNELVVYCPIK